MTLDLIVLAYVERMSNVLNEFGDDILNLKTKFALARRELEPEEEERTQMDKIHRQPRSLAFSSKKKIERNE